MEVAVLILALVSGLATVVFILIGLHRAVRRHKTLGARALVLTTVFSLLTGVFTVWQLVLVAQQLHFGP
jgi:dolichol kinase